MVNFPITKNQIIVLSDKKLQNVLQLCQEEWDRRQKQYFEKLKEKM